MSEFRTIVHIDLDAFYCAVEEQFNPELRGKPYAVGGRPEHRGVVSSCSYAARQLGIHSAMPMAHAVRICPELIILPGRHRDYSRESRKVMKVLHAISPLIEQISIDEAFMDATALNRDKAELAADIQHKIMEATSLPCSLGIASNKLVAKIATDIGKASVRTKTYPQAIQIVPEGQEAHFLAPLGLEILWGVGPKTAEKLRQFGIKTIGDLASWPVKDLVDRFGKNGYDLHKRANGIDNREVVTHREPKSFSQEITFSQDTNDLTKLHKILHRQSESVAISLQKARVLGSTIKLKIRWSDFSVITRQITLPHPTDNPTEIYQQAEILLDQHWNRKDLIRLIGVGVANLHEPEQQLSLWDQKDYTKLAKLEAALYKVKSKYGDESISKGKKSPQTDRKKADNE